MRRLLIAVTFLVLTPVLGADDTQVLLDATRVDRNILLILDGKVVRFKTDDGQHGGTIDTARTFAGTDGFDVLLQNYNPLQLNITAAEKKEAEPTTKNAGDFLGPLADTLKLLPGLGGAAPGTVVGTTEIKSCSQLTQVFQEAQTALAKLADISLDQLTPNKQTTRNEWTKGATGRPGIQHVRDDMRIFLGDVNGKLMNAKNQVATLRNLNLLRTQLVGARAITAADLKKAEDTIANEEKKSPKDQKAIDAATTAKATAQAKLAEADTLLACWPDTLTTLTTAASIIDAHQKLATGLAALIVTLDALDNDAKWSSPNNFVVLATETQPDIQDTITVKITPVKLSDAGELVPQTDATISRDLILREYRRFVPEFGAAGIYTDLRYPKYTLKDDNGKKVVAANGFDTTNVNAAVTMNLFCNCLGGHTLYPGFQLGVSKAKDYPGLLAGVALRFAGVKRFSVSTGRMVTWYKDLNKLHVGDQAASENDINADLKLRRATTAWYLGAQFTF